MIYNSNEQLVTELENYSLIQNTANETLPNKWEYHPKHFKIFLTKNSSLSQI